MPTLYVLRDKVEQQAYRLAERLVKGPKVLSYPAQYFVRSMYDN